MKRLNSRINLVQSMLEDQAGMTIIEIIIILLIIGVLAATVLVQLKNTSESARAAACLSNQAAMKTAINIYYARHRYHYPYDLDDIIPYLVEEELPECPSEGTYQLINRSEIQCSLEEHQ